MARRNDHTRDELRALILEAAWSTIEKEGFEGLTARHIAKQIGYAPGTIYNLFDSMDDLYQQLNARTLDLLYEALSSPACNKSHQTPVQNIKKMAALYMAFAQKNKPYWLLLFNHYLSEEQTSKDWYQKKIGRLFLPLENLLEPLFTTEQAQKRKTAARVLWASVHGLCILQETGKISVTSEKSSAPDMLEYLINTFVAGFSAEY